MSTYAPIVLFAYARPAHLRQTLQALEKNHLADKSKLVILIDGAKPNADAATKSRIQEVQAIAQERQWCGQVEVRARETNLGLADSIRTGVSQVVAEHGRVIVLEDDLVTSPGFLQYMNDALDQYQNQREVFQISGFMVKTPKSAPETAFLRSSTSWGWATWDRAWTHYNNDAPHLLKEVEKAGKERFDLDGHAFYFDELKRNAEGQLKSWHVRWYASLFLKNGLCLFPHKSLVRNLGFDDSGENCDAGSNKHYRQIPIASTINVQTSPVTENPIYLASMQAHFDCLRKLWTKPSIKARIASKLTRMFKG